MIKNIYLIGNHPYESDTVTQLNYYKVQMMLIENGFNTINPHERLSNKEYALSDARKKNLKDLMDADAVYIMPDVEINQNNLEIKLALNINLHIISSIFDCAPAIPVKRQRSKVNHKNT